ncbi:MAG: glucose-6-phosphate isomerase [Bacteroidota bacterium]
MKNLTLTIENVFPFVNKNNVFKDSEKALSCLKNLHDKTGKGNDFLGWLDLPSGTDIADIKKIEKIAGDFQDKAEILVVIGIGGSYLGAKAIIDALSNNFSHLVKNRKFPVVIFAGNNISEDYHYELLELLDNYNYAISMISKSGTTTEPAVAFRLLKQHIEKKYGKAEAVKRIVAITDSQKGALKQLSISEGYNTFNIPDDVGGRYSVLTPVGLFPIAVAGYNIEKLMEGAKSMEMLSKSADVNNNPVILYSLARNSLYKSGKLIEILVNYDPRLHFLSEWWKQLFGESEGKEGKGIFPASVDFTSDLHSMGQYIQEGNRILFETVLSIEETHKELHIPLDADNLDKLNFLSGKRMDEVNKKAELGTLMAHVEGNVPNIKISIPKLDEFYLGQLIYFFEKSCALSGYLLDVNPFDQPGVEAYKKNMFELLGKPK